MCSVEDLSAAFDYRREAQLSSAGMELWGFVETSWRGSGGSSVGGDIGPAPQRGVDDAAKVCTYGIGLGNDIPSAGLPS